MKKTEIILILLVAVIIGVILSLTYNASTYITFTDAEKRIGKEYTVIGELIKEKGSISLSNSLCFLMVIITNPKIIKL